MRILESFADSEDGRDVKFSLASNDPDIQDLLSCYFKLRISGSIDPEIPDYGNS